MPYKSMWYMISDTRRSVITSKSANVSVYIHTDRYTVTQTHTHSDTQTDRHTDWHSDTDGITWSLTLDDQSSPQSLQMCLSTYTDRCTVIHRQTQWYTDRQTHTDTHSDTQTVTHGDRHTDTHCDRHTSTQTDRATETHRLTDTQTPRKRKTDRHTWLRSDIRKSSRPPGNASSRYVLTSRRSVLLPVHRQTDRFRHRQTGLHTDICKQTDRLKTQTDTQTDK